MVNKESKRKEMWYNARISFLILCLLIVETFTTNRDVRTFTGCMVIISCLVLIKKYHKDTLKELKDGFLNNR